MNLCAWRRGEVCRRWGGRRMQRAARGSQQTTAKSSIPSPKIAASLLGKRLVGGGGNSMQRVGVKCCRGGGGGWWQWRGAQRRGHNDEGSTGNAMRKLCNGRGDTTLAEVADSSMQGPNFSDLHGELACKARKQRTSKMVRHVDMPVWTLTAVW